MAKFLKNIPWYLWNLFLLCLAILVLVINIRLHNGPDLRDRAALRQHAGEQLAFLQEEIELRNLAWRMQEIFPEGFVFTHVLHGLAWCEWAKEESNDEKRALALQAARQSYAFIDSEEGRKVFSENLPLPYGMFYQGWRNYLLGKIVEGDGGKEKERKQLADQTGYIVAALNAANKPFLESYGMEAWPADACVAMASVAIHDRIFGPKYPSVLRKWVADAKQRLDPATGLMPHKMDFANDRPDGGPRGCSAVLNLYFLPEIDPQFALDQFLRFDSLFGFDRLGLGTVREYPKGSFGLGDVDSGPVVLGVGFSATIVGIGSYLRFGEYAKAQSISDAVEALGFSYSRKGRRRYIFGALPIADAFISWARLQEPDAELIQLHPAQAQGLGSKFRFHCWSALVLLGLGVLRFGKSWMRKASAWYKSKRLAA
jgi:hypothetical protein